MVLGYILFCRFKCLILFIYSHIICSSTFDCTYLLEMDGPWSQNCTVKITKGFVLTHWMNWGATSFNTCADNQIFVNPTVSTFCGFYSELSV